MFGHMAPRPPLTLLPGGLAHMRDKFGLQASVYSLKCDLAGAGAEGRE